MERENNRVLIDGGPLGNKSLKEAIFKTIEKLKESASPESTADWNGLIDRIREVTATAELIEIYQSLREAIAKNLEEPALAEIKVRMPNGSIRPFKNLKEAKECLQRMESELI